MKVRIAIFIIFCITSAFVVFSKKYISSEVRVPGYDEKFWTNNAIVSYNMFLGNFEQDHIIDDSWFTSYAAQEGLNIFGPDRKSIDYNKIPKKIYQWFDFRLWTFGWKAPNFNKLSKGAYIYLTENSDSINAAGYAKLGLEEYGDNPKLYFPRFVPDRFVVRARQLDAFFCCCTLAVVFLTGWFFFDFIVGLSAGIFLLLNKIFIGVSTASGMDSSALLFTALSVFFLMWGFRTIQKGDNLKKLILLSLGLGVSMGLAVSSKYNAALVFYIAIALAPLLLICIWRIFNELRKTSSKKKKNKAKEKAQAYLNRSVLNVGVVLLTVGLSSATAFLSINPQMRNDTVKKVKIIRASVDRFFEIRAQGFNTLDIKNNWGKSFEVVLKRNYWRMNTDENYYGTLGSLLPFKHNILDLILVGFGLVLCFLRGFRAFWYEKNINSYLIALVAFLIIFYYNVEFIWVDWSRYHTPFYVVGTVVMGITISYIADLAKAYFYSSRPAN